MVSATIGGGIVGIPYVFYNLGFILAFVIISFVAFVSWMGSLLVIKAKDISPRHYESFYELGYMVMGRFAILFIGLVQFTINMGALMIYFIVFVDTIIPVILQILTGPDIISI